jgi:hypothetical protein
LNEAIKVLFIREESHQSVEWGIAKTRSKKKYLYLVKIATGTLKFGTRIASISEVAMP